MSHSVTLDARETKKKAKQALKFTEEARDRATSWVDLYNALFGIGGKISALFPDELDRTEFIKTDAHKQIMEMIDKLRDETGDPAPLAEGLTKAKGAISVRLPKAIHAALLAEAEEQGVSLNQLCVAKLCVQLRAAVG